MQEKVLMIIAKNVYVFLDKLELEMNMNDIWSSPLEDLLSKVGQL